MTQQDPLAAAVSPWDGWLQAFSTFMADAATEPGLVEAGQVLYRSLYEKTALFNAEAFTEIQGYEVSLDEDPTIVGLGTLTEKLAKIQSYKDRLTRLSTGVLATIMCEWDRFQGEAEAAIGRVTDADLVGAEMKACGHKNKEEKQAQTNVWHPGLVELKVFLADGVRQAKWIEAIIKERLRNLESTNSNASRQITVLQLMLETGELRRGGTATR